MKSSNSKWLFKAPHYILSIMMCSLVFAMMIGGLADIIFRYLINRPIPGMSELLSIGLGLLVYGSLPLVTANNEHIRVDLISWDNNKYVSMLVKFTVNALGSLMLFAMTWAIAKTAIDFASYGDRSSFLKIDLSLIAWAMSAMSLFCGLILMWNSIEALLTNNKEEAA